MHVPWSFKGSGRRTHPNPGLRRRSFRNGGRSRSSRLVAAALALATAAGLTATAAQPARADIIDDLLGIAADFTPFFHYTQQAYDFYGKYVAGQPTVPNIQAAINTAKTQIIAEIDAVAAANVVACANNVVN